MLRGKSSCGDKGMKRCKSNGTHICFIPRTGA
jgi:hypothetical protein